MHASRYEEQLQRSAYAALISGPSDVCEDGEGHFGPNETNRERGYARKQRFVGGGGAVVYGEERSVVELKKEVERLQHELRRERSTVRALQEKLIREEEANAKLKEHLEACQIVVDTAHVPLTDRSRRSNRRHENSTSSRPPWNNDFTSSNTTTEKTSGDITPGKERDNRISSRPPWNNDFTSSTPVAETTAANASLDGNRDPRSQSLLKVPFNRSLSATAKNRDARKVTSQSRLRQAATRPDRPIEASSSQDRLDRGTQQPDEYAPGPATLMPCSICGRTFHPDRLEKHRRVCMKNARNSSKKGRNTFSSAAKRAAAIAELNGIAHKKANMMIRRAKKNGDTHSAGKTSKWKRESRQLRETLRSARVVTKSGTTAPSSLASSSYREPDDYIRCPHCSRTFSQKAGERHIPHCEKAMKRKRFGRYRA